MEAQEKAKEKKVTEEMVEEELMLGKDKIKSKLYKNALKSILGGG